MRDMLEAAREVVEFAAGKTWSDYRASTQLRRSIERSIEIIGEAARRVSPDCQAQHPAIPSDRIIPTRHRLAHEYDRLDDAIVWSIAIRHVPTLIAELERVLPPDPPEDA
ncbi:MAG: DUF86 domain-containing protein [Phycisphaeraceae bacterium]|nr:DUF86 domain-containing protein [Phycisphaeraceae bacterium]